MDIKSTITHIKNYIESRGYSFEENLVETFLLCLKTKPVVMLQSACSNDSAVFAKLFFESIGATLKNKRFKVYSPGGNSEKIRNPICYTDCKGNFCPGEITKFIIKASADSKNVYALYIDDINLINPDELLREILRAYDTPCKNDTGSLTYGTLFDEDFFESEDEKAKYGNIILPPNLYIIAGICSDSSIYPVSERIRSKLNIINVNCRNFKTLSANSSTEPADNIGADFINCECPDYTVKEFNKHLEKYNDILNKINNTLSYIGKGFGINTRNEILFYIMTNRKFNLLSDDEAFDNCLAQRILTLLQGTGNNLKNVLSLIFKECVTKGVGDYTECSLNMYRALTYPNCRFGKSAAKIAEITRYIEENGFYIF